MKGLYYLFLRQVIRQSAVMCVITAIGLIAVQQFFFHQMGLASYLALALAWFTIAIHQASQCLPKNINWIAVLPFSRPRILWLTTLINASILLIAGICFSLVVIAVDLIKFGTLQNAPAIWSSLTTLLRYLYLKLFSHPSAFAWATLFLCSAYFFALLTSPTWRGTHQTLSLRLILRKLWFPEDTNRRLFQQTGILILFTLLILMKNFLLAPFGVFCFFLLFMAKLCPRMWKVSINISRKEQAFATAFLLTIGFIEMGWVYGLERKALRSASTDERVGAIEFLGPFAGKHSQASLAEILESDLGKEAIASIGQLYKVQFHEGKKIRADRDRVLSFQKAIDSKEGLTAIIKTLELFDSSSLTRADLQQLFKSMSPLSRDPRETRVFLMALDSQLTKEDTKAFIVSPMEAEARYGLIRARYVRDPSFLEVIQKQMPKFSDELVYVALNTLSILKGQRQTLDDWREVRGGRSLATTLFEPHCSDIKEFNLQSVTPNEVALINSCLRERANKADLFLLEDIEDAGWIAPPFNNFQKTVLSEVYEIVD